MKMKSRTFCEVGGPSNSTIRLMGAGSTRTTGRTPAEAASSTREGRRPGRGSLAAAATRVTSTTAALEDGPTEGTGGGQAWETAIGDSTPDQCEQRVLGQKTLSSVECI